eukprot:TRINITY_DN122964_c0_g1_i1.p1 TRINITY_DN122964_c0_g1~~TRINITY_DN122964_c0_g1_i1.p1  ORF type:complete len:674 (-),score=73.87 TRINITY_DN122964_c0_g1_i1:74-2095(-)
MLHRSRHLSRRRSHALPCWFAALSFVGSCVPAAKGSLQLTLQAVFDDVVSSGNGSLHCLQHLGENFSDFYNAPEGLCTALEALDKHWDDGCSVVFQALVMAADVKLAGAVCLAAESCKAYNALMSPMIAECKAQCKNEQHCASRVGSTGACDRYISVPTCDASFWWKVGLDHPGLCGDALPQEFGFDFITIPVDILCTVGLNFVLFPLQALLVMKTKQTSSIGVGTSLNSGMQFLILLTCVWRVFRVLAIPETTAACRFFVFTMWSLYGPAAVAMTSLLSTLGVRTDVFFLIGFPCFSLLQEGDYAEWNYAEIVLGEGAGLKTREDEIYGRTGKSPTLWSSVVGSWRYLLMLNYQRCRASIRLTQLPLYIVFWPMNLLGMVSIVVGISLVFVNLVTMMIMGIWGYLAFIHITLFFCVIACPIFVGCSGAAVFHLQFIAGRIESARCDGRPQRNVEEDQKNMALDKIRFRMLFNLYCAMVVPLLQTMMACLVAVNMMYWHGDWMRFHDAFAKQLGSPTITFPSIREMFVDIDVASWLWGRFLQLELALPMSFLYGMSVLTSILCNIVNLVVCAFSLATSCARTSTRDASDSASQPAADCLGNQDVEVPPDVMKASQESGSSSESPHALEIPSERVQSDKNAEDCAIVLGHPADESEDCATVPAHFPMTLMHDAP